MSGATLTSVEGVYKDGKIELLDEPAGIREARVIVTATSSRVPLFSVADVAPGTHVNAIGAFQPDAAELPEELVVKARIVVDTMDAATTSGDLAIPLAHGLVTRDQVTTELSDVMLGRREGRTSKTDITIYKSVGTSFLDIAVAHLIFTRAQERHFGQTFVFTRDNPVLQSTGVREMS